MDPVSWLIILIVAIGLGLVIFVHELGHFAVAKLCGVKCEKFYLGFDIAGWRICRFRWGETEYGIGAFPLGGYVKMLGQEDNPARLREELERAKAAQAVGAAPSTGDSETPVDVAAAEAALYDPRSYLAQSVPKRMAIISAGVIMNLLFAFAAAVIAYAIGVNEQPCEIGPIQPGYPAWQADLRPGDRIVAINGEPTRRFKDVMTRIPLNKEGDAATLRIERPGAAEPFEVVVHPSRKLLIPAIGVSATGTTTLLTSIGWLNNDKIKPYIRNTTAARAEPPFQLGDKIVKIDDVAVETYAQLCEMLSARRDRPIEVTVQRDEEKGKSVRLLTIRVNPQPMRRLGLVMEMGPIMSVQDGSPAAQAGIKAGDRIVAIDGNPPGDPMTLPDRLWKEINAAVAQGDPPPTVMLTLKRMEEAKGKDDPSKQKEETLEVPIALRKTDAVEMALFAGSPVSVPSLGVAYYVLNTVAGVVPDSPAAQAGVVPGQVLVNAAFVPPDEASLAREGLKPGDVCMKPVEFTDQKRNWPALFEAMQGFTLPGAKIELKFKDGKTVLLEPVDAADWHHPERGFQLQGAGFMLTAQSFGEALKLGGEETWLQATLVLRLLQRLSTGELSLKVIGGPITIAKVAGRAASRSLSEFLIFLTMISATLAVINFLPIPVLDGGHFVFLLYEGIRGKPVDERVQLALSYLGLILILALMVWAFGLDLTLIPRD
ncbi:MAG: site-2 protease family protein [Pirellulales bacterium]|nr:site-2 protease family protein [Pirellulales bacterium]